MAVNPMQRKARNSFLLGMIISLLITGVIIVFLFLQLKQMNDEKRKLESENATVYIINQDVKSGQVLTSDMIQTQKINKNMIPANATSDQLDIDAWSLQTKDGKRIQRDGEGLYISESDGIIELLSKDGKYVKASDGEKVTVKTEPYKDETGTETRYFVTTTEEGQDEKTRIYEEEITQNYFKYKIENNEVKKEFIELNSVPLLAKINMKANTVITPDLVVQSDQVVTDDVRKQEYNVVILPVDLMTDDYVDIRLMLPNGQDFIVISKAQVTVPTNGDGTYVADTISVNLREDEILAMSNAIVESYGILGSKLYATRYAEPGIQSASLPTYTPSAEVTALINSNPNIVTLAEKEIKSRYSDYAKNIRNQYINEERNKIDSEEFKESIQENMQTDIVNSEEARKKYLETLGGE